MASNPSQTGAVQDLQLVVFLVAAVVFAAAEAPVSAAFVAAASAVLEFSISSDLLFAAASAVASAAVPAHEPVDLIDPVVVAAASAAAYPSPAAVALAFADGDWISAVLFVAAAAASASAASASAAAAAAVASAAAAAAALPLVGTPAPVCTPVAKSQRLLSSADGDQETPDRGIPASAADACADAVFADGTFAGSADHEDQNREQLPAVSIAPGDQPCSSMVSPLLSIVLPFPGALFVAQGCYFAAGADVGAAPAAGTAAGHML